MSDELIPVPLTWGQRAILGTIDQLGSGGDYFNILRVVPLPEYIAPAQIRKLVTTVTTENSALRTLALRSGPHLFQHTVAPETIRVEVYETGGNVLARARAVAANLAAAPIDHAAQPPVRWAAVTSQKGEAALAIAASHFAVDAYALALLVRRVTELAADASAEQCSVWQPRAQALQESTPGAAVRTSRAIDRWKRVTGQVPASACCVPDKRDRPDRFVEWSLDSVDMVAASTRVATRTGSSLASVVLAVWCIAIGVLDGRSAASMTLISGNRVREYERRYVGPMAQDTAMCVEWSALLAFDDFVSQVHREALSAYADGKYDPEALAASLGASSGEVRPPRKILTFFNDARGQPSHMSTTGASPLAGEPRRLGAWPMLDLARFLMLQETPMGCRLRLLVDTEYVEDRRVPELLLAIENAVIAGAEARTVDDVRSTFSARFAE
ncbi:condensation domain-containing protein [Krasilnikovia sp. M28-CT-15]|uniref:condensation domain-containing protein n=1 Tax=Krasilnikovia sp. M28-CT-15 TaxID=3373540 RepID=UPI003875B555